MNLQIAAQELCEALRVPLPKDLRLKPKDNAVTALLHWRCLLTLVAMLERHQEHSLKAMFNLSPESQKRLPSLSKPNDSHCHTDKKIREVSLADLLLAIVRTVKYPAIGVAKVTNCNGCELLRQATANAECLHISRKALASD